MNGERLATCALIDKNTDDQAIGAFGHLPRAIHVEVAQAHRLETIDAGEVAGVDLAHQLLAGIRVERVGRHILGQR